MNSRTILIESRDPLIFRDPRPAGAGLPIRSLDWPLPPTVIGAIRTRLGRGSGFDKDTVAQLLQIEHVGPLLAERTGSGWELCFPAPADAVLFHREDSKGVPSVELRRLRPCRLRDDEGTDLDCNGMSNLIPLFGASEEKPLRGPAFWKQSAALEWLNDKPGTVSTARDLGPPGSARQTRVHLEVDAGTFAAKEGQLFSTESLELAGRWEDDDWRPVELAICSQIRAARADWDTIEGAAPLGGERRLGYWSEPSIQWPTAPDFLGSVKRFRLQTITPAPFGGGWRPGWINDQLEGTPPSLPKSKIRLIAAAVPRPVAHSGWDLATGKQKATRFLAPAGSVYFFESEQEVDVRELWLKSICDRPQDQCDGFGIVLAGGWEWQQS